MERAEKKDVTITTWKTKGTGGKATLSIVALNTTEADAWGQDGGEYRIIHKAGPGCRPWIAYDGAHPETLSIAWVKLLHVVRMARIANGIVWKRADRPPQPSNGATHVHTSHFISFDTACDYYEPYGTDPESVRLKVKAGEITIGAPVGAIGVNEEGRYVVAMGGSK